jgi:hypothetical protein
LFIQLTVQTEKGVNYRRTDVTSNFILTSVKDHKIAWQSFHVFKGSEKGLKGDPLCFGSPKGKTKSEKDPGK